MKDLSDVHIVLVGTTHAGNVGATARAMKNMGLSRLRLVDPCRYQTQEAFVRASGAGEIIKNAQVYDTLALAIADCTSVYGTSARTRAIESGVLEVRDAAQQVVEKLSNSQAAYRDERGEFAIVFGRERSGLSNEELALCDRRLHIPCNPEFSSLNLGSAVQVVAYELHHAWLRSTPRSVEGSDATLVDSDQVAPRADSASLEGFFSHLEQTITEIEFLDPKNPRLLMPKLRRYFMRNRPDNSELNILRGILSAVQKTRAKRTKLS